MILTITNDRKDESEEVCFVPDTLFDYIVESLPEWRVFPTPRRTTTVGAEPDACPSCGGYKCFTPEGDFAFPVCGCK